MRGPSTGCESWTSRGWSRATRSPRARGFRRGGDQGRAARRRYAAWLEGRGGRDHLKLYARGKKSLCLDLRREESRELLLGIAATAHVFIESFRPDTLEKMGLGPDVLLARNPRLVVVRISGWVAGRAVPRRPGFGTLVEGMSGFASFTGFADREPVLRRLPRRLGRGPIRRVRRDDRAARGRGKVAPDRSSTCRSRPALRHPRAAGGQLPLTGTVKPRTGTARRHPGRATPIAAATRSTWGCRHPRRRWPSARCARSAPELIDDPRYRNQRRPREERRVRSTRSSVSSSRSVPRPRTSRSSSRPR